MHSFYERALGAGHFEVVDRNHFFAIAARAMQQLLVDKHRRASSKKRGAGFQQIRLNDLGDAAAELDTDLLDLDMAITELETEDARAAEVVRLRFFAGLTMQELAAVIGVSKPTVERQWRTARAWLQARLQTSRDDR